MIIPAITPILYNRAAIFIFCLIPLLVLNNTANPTPAPTNNPEIAVAKEITFSKYICVKITDDAQFGISPMIPARIGPNIGWFCKNPEIRSSPIKYIAPFIIIVINKINTKIFIVCLNADFTIPCSQWQWSFSHKSIIFSSSSSLCLNLLQNQ